MSLQTEGRQYHRDWFVVQLFGVNRKCVVTIHTLNFFILFKCIDRGIIRLCSTRYHENAYVHCFHFSQVWNVWKMC